MLAFSIHQVIALVVLITYVVADPVESTLDRRLLKWNAASLAMEGKQCVEVLGIDHRYQPSGKYFSFSSHEVPTCIGGPDFIGYSKLHSITQYRRDGGSTTGLVRVWNNPCGDSGDSHGRYEPYDEADGGDWQVGDFVCFNDVECHDVEEYCIKVQSNDHKWAKDGQYFNFFKSDFDSIPGGVAHGSVELANHKRNGRIIRENQPVKIWKNNGGGSVGDGHGRYEPYSEAGPGQWQRDDEVCILILE